MEQALLDSLAKTFIDILVPVALLGLLALMERVWGWLRVRMDAQQQEFIDMLVKRYVLAAEQYSLEGKISSAGEDKFRWVMDKLELILKSRGYNVELDSITDHIVAKVHEEFNKLPPETIDLVSDLGDDQD